MWGLIGVLCGSLISGAFSYASARLAYDASENTAIKTQETNERTLAAQRNQAREQFFRDQRVAVYGKYLSASQWSEIAMYDILTVIKTPSYAPADREFWRSNFEFKYREFIDAGWNLEFFATEELQAVANEMNAELQERHKLLLEQYYLPAAAQVEALTRRMSGPEDKMFQLRSKFTKVVRDAVSS